MRIIIKHILLIFFGILLLPNDAWSQETENLPNAEPENVTDAFQENFFEALKQKGIENYELALIALNKAEKAAKSEENKAVVYFEMGKNHTYLKQYAQAEENFNKVLKSQGDKLDVLEQFYELYYQQKDYEKAIPLVQKLIPFDEDYKEDLANLYTLTKQYDKALEQLDNLDQIWGESDIRNALRAQIYRASGNTEGAIENLEQKIDNNPKNEKEYLNLIFLYSEQGNKEKAFEAAKNLLESNPNSQLVHLALYKFYLDEGNAVEAIKSMKIVFASEEVDKETKYKVLGDFIQYVNENPEYETQLAEIVSQFSIENGRVYEKLGDYYAAKNRKEDALTAYEKGIAQDPDNYHLLKNTLLFQIDFKKYDAAVKLSAEGLEIFPSQALLYLLNGVANNGLQKSDAAIESLEIGLDFILEDPKMERDFYQQLSLAYSTKGDDKKAKMYSDKAAATKMPN
ncbi:MULTISPECIES: tetratricopeptide repeat protein [Aequorivita]|uniref:Tetratricopeptide repeat protein n=1 Tax=Aequorivita iocasae TaxID=2803865 RepID=A0ABX7DVC3_9FLAO|nr:MULTISPECIES: tetratricopeptide repeat protein [Aequorivita]QQX77757.1 tetratricopeptide repeat protein [Aequorivita iocasae]UCA57256.1 tetratricopeptide repeat protein [Aequorivita sp. F7]